jgi:hypothetical protein
MPAMKLANSISEELGVVWARMSTSGHIPRIPVISKKKRSKKRDSFPAKSAITRETETK